MRVLASDSAFVDPRHRRRVPGDGDIDALEFAGPDHERLGGAAFLCRAAIVAHAALDAGGG